MTRVRLLCATIALAAFGCSGPAQQEFGRADADDLRKMIQALASAYNQKDASAAAAFFSGEAVLLVPNSSPVRGRDSIRGFFDIRFKQGATDLNLEVVDVGGHGPLAFASGSYSLRLQPPEGKESKDRGKFLSVVRKYGGRWLFDYQMWSSDLPVQTSELVK